MIAFGGQMPMVYLATQYVDMRKSIDGLAVLVNEQLEGNPLSGHLFVFYNRSKDKIKILYWERNGFCLWYKRLEKHHFHIPDVNGPTLEMTSEQLSWLLSGLNLQELKAHPSLHYSCVK